MILEKKMHAIPTANPGRNMRHNKINRKSNENPAKEIQEKEERGGKEPPSGRVEERRKDAED